MTWLTENPFWICTAGLFLGFCLFFFFVHTRRKAFAILGTLSVVLAIVAYVASLMIVTDDEAVRRTVKKLANGVASNSTETVMQHISKSTDFYDRARSEMDENEFLRCWVSDTSEIVFSESEGKATADIDLKVLVSVTSSPHAPGGGSAQIVLNLTFAKENDGKWRVHAYRWRPANVEEFNNNGETRNGYR